MKLLKIIPTGWLFVTLILPFSIKAQVGDADQQEKIQAALSIITSQYVDALDREDIVEQAITGMLKKLDPHSVYLPKNKVATENQKLASEFEGIGIQFNILNDTIMVISPISGGPSEKLGIQSGDKIVKIEEETVAGTGITNKGVRDRLLGKKGTKVNVSIKRRNEKELIEYTIVRDKIPMYSVDASYIVEDNIGYIKVNRFAASTAQEFRDAVKELKKEGMQSLILDLSGNGGGYLYSAFELADEFLNYGKMIVYTEGESNPKRELKASARGYFEEGRLIVLIDEGSASASEIVTGAVQDWDRGIVIGRRSFGKGLVQKPFKLPDGSEIRLTIARYYTPTGRSIQKSYENGKKEYYSETMKRLENGELNSIDSIAFPDSLKFLTPNKRIVYGGGGIMPDIFIPIDTSNNSKFIRDVNRKGVLNQFSLAYVDDNRIKLEKNYTDIHEFKQGFDVETIMDEFVNFADSRDIDCNQAQMEKSSKLLKYQLTGLIARNLFDIEAYYYIFNEYRHDFNRALKVIKDDETFKQMRVQN